MARKETSSSAPRSVFLCSACGNDSPKWFGRCPHCGEWNTAVEETARAPAPAQSRAYGTGTPPQPTRLAGIEAPGEEPHRSGICQLDLAVGEGLVPGTLVLV